MLTLKTLVFAHTITPTKDSQNVLKILGFLIRFVDKQPAEILGEAITILFTQIYIYIPCSCLKYLRSMVYKNENKELILVRSYDKSIIPIFSKGNVKKV